MARKKRKPRLQDLIQEWEPKLRDAFLAAVQGLRNGVDEVRLIEAISSGQIEEALAAVNIEPSAYTPYVEEIRNAYRTSGEFSVSQMPPLQDVRGVKVTMRFDVRDLGAEEWINEHSSKAIKEISDDLKQSVRDKLTKGLVDGTNPVTTARDIAGRYNRKTGEREGGILGLTNRQRQSVENAAEELRTNPKAYLDRKLRNKSFDHYVRKSIETGEPIPEDIQKKMVNALQSRTEKKRADTVARTESMTSMHAAQREAYQQAINKGLASPDEIEREWSATSRSKPTRESHQELDGQKVKFNEPYVSPITGARLMYPGDPKAPAEEIINCRCWEMFRINYLKRIKG